MPTVGHLFHSITTCLAPASPSCNPRQVVSKSVCYLSDRRALLERFVTWVGRLIEEHRDALENGIYADGLEHVRHLMCTDLVHACGSHSLFDAGEL